MSTSSKAKSPISKTPVSTRPPSSVQKAEVHEQGADTVALLRKRELIEAVVRRSGIKKRDAKPVIEAMLEELGACLAAGREMALPPLGRIKINREKAIPNGRVIVLKLRQKDRLTAPATKATATQ